MTTKRFLSANELLEDAYTLGARILEDGFKPDLIIGIARGGEPLAIAIHELFCFSGMAPEYQAIRATSYSGIDQQEAVQFQIPDAIAVRIADSSSVLFVDDVFDTGKTLSAICDSVKINQPDTEVRCATAWFKPARNETSLVPNYYLHETDDWLVFPHELCGLETAELTAHKAGLSPEALKAITSAKK